MNYAKPLVHINKEIVKLAAAGIISRLLAKMKANRAAYKSIKNTPQHKKIMRGSGLMGAGIAMMLYPFLRNWDEHHPRDRWDFSTSTRSGEFIDDSIETVGDWIASVRDKIGI